MQSCISHCLTRDSVYSFNLDKSVQDFPTIYSKLIWGSKEVRWDVSCPKDAIFNSVTKLTETS
jgi:hypothetical protein